MKISGRMLSFSFTYCRLILLKTLDTPSQISWHSLSGTSTLRLGVLRWIMIPCPLRGPSKLRTPIPHNVYDLTITAAGLTSYWMTVLSCLDDCSRRSSLPHLTLLGHGTPYHGPLRRPSPKGVFFQEKGPWEGSSAA